MTDIRRSQAGERAIVTVSGHLTVPHAKKVRTALLEAVQSASSVEVVVENVVELDVSFPQLVCSTHRMAADLNKQLLITGIEQERFSDMLRRSGFARHIGCHENTRKSCLWLHGLPAAGPGKLDREVSKKP
jgi:hypothetical protein